MTPDHQQGAAQDCSLLLRKQEDQGRTFVRLFLIHMWYSPVRTHKEIINTLEGFVQNYVIVLTINRVSNIIHHVFSLIKSD